MEQSIDVLGAGLHRRDEVWKGEIGKVIWSPRLDDNGRRFRKREERIPQ
jgi:hypothetical protein